MVLLLALALPFSARAENSGLERLTTRENVFGWEAVGRLDLPQGFCTGVLIAPDLVLTAAHCMYDARRRAMIEPSQMTFRAGLTDGVAIAERKGLRHVSHPAYRHDVGVTPDNVRHDVALLQLDAPIPSAIAAPFSVGQMGGRGSELSVVSYAVGRDDALSWQRTCRILGKGQGLVGFDCDVTFGASGAPVFDRTGRRATIVSLVSAGGAQDAYGMELAPRVEEVKSALRSGAGVVELTNTRRSTFGFISPDRRNSGSGAKFVPASP